ncbi:MAG: flhB [Alphaproteobacteria bacterium]|nr:flhB [Alphaproteobacteria bacterium]
MAEGGDDEDKTEEPSAKKLKEAREKGQVAQSKEVNTWVILFTATLMLGIMAVSIAERLSYMLKEFIARPQSFQMDSHAIADMFQDLIIDLVGIMGFPMGVFFVAATIASFVQVGPLISTHSLAPSLDKIDPLKGMKRVFGGKAWIEFAKAFIKMVLVGSVTTIILMPIFDEAPGMVGVQPGQMLDIMRHETKDLLVGVLSVLFVFAGLDYGMQRFQLNKQLRMSRQELRDEYKQSEGDPHIKGRLRELRLKRARKRMMANVPNASVIITNPTHFAIALEYNQEKAGAPVVVAKGQDRIALRIREIAKENNVPIVENKPLARAMYDSAELDQEIPEEHFKAVAEIISYVMTLRR